MKGQPFKKRMGFAWNGMRIAFSIEPSFRFQILAGVFAFIFLGVTHAAAEWWALFTLTVALVLGAELFNTALESALDHIHPEIHVAIKVSKDCAAAAVLIFSIASVGVFLAYLIHCYG